MIIKKVYKPIEKRKVFMSKAARLLGFLFIISSIVSVVLNIILKGKPWALLVATSLYMIWIFILSPTLVEYNRIDQTVKLLSLVCLLLLFIELFFKGGWGITVIPIILFSGLILLSILLFTNYEKQKHNVWPYYLLLIFSLAVSIVGISLDVVTVKWVYIVLLSVSAFYLFVVSFLLKNNIFKEFKKRFSIK